MFDCIMCRNGVVVKIISDFFKAFSSIDGFEFVEELDMSFNKKQYGKQYNDEKGVIKNSEPIMVFKKVK